MPTILETRECLDGWAEQLIDYLWDDEQRNFGECGLAEPDADREEVTSSAYYAIVRLAELIDYDLPMKWIDENPS